MAPPEKERSIDPDQLGELIVHLQNQDSLYARARGVHTSALSDGKDLVVLGSGELVQSLLRAGLVDALVLSIHPLVLGTGRRLFLDGAPPAAYRLADSKTTSTGVVVGTYQPAS